MTLGMTFGKSIKLRVPRIQKSLQYIILSSTHLILCLKRIIFTYNKPNPKSWLDIKSSWLFSTMVLSSNKSNFVPLLTCLTFSGLNSTEEHGSFLAFCHIPHPNKTIQLFNFSFLYLKPTTLLFPGRSFFKFSTCKC